MKKLSVLISVFKYLLIAMLVFVSYKLSKSSNTYAPLVSFVYHIGIMSYISLVWCYFDRNQSKGTLIEPKYFPFKILFVIFLFTFAGVFGTVGAHVPSTSTFSVFFGYFIGIVLGGMTAQSIYNTYNFFFVNFRPHTESKAPRPAKVKKENLSLPSQSVEEKYDWHFKLTPKKPY